MLHYNGLCLSIYPFPSAILVLCPVLVPFVMHSGAKWEKARDMTLSWSVTGSLQFVIQQNGPDCHFPCFVPCFHEQRAVCHCECLSGFVLNFMLYSMLHGMCLYGESKLCYVTLYAPIYALISWMHMLMRKWFIYFMCLHWESIRLCLNEWFICSSSCQISPCCSWTSSITSATP